MRREGGYTEWVNGRQGWRAMRCDGDDVCVWIFSLFPACPDALRVTIAACASVRPSVCCTVSSSLVHRPWTVNEADAPPPVRNYRARQRHTHCRQAHRRRQTDARAAAPRLARGGIFNKHARRMK